MRILRSISFLPLLFVLLAVPIKSSAQFSLRITIAPPELVVYSQPVCPQEGYLWTPGYWAYGDEGYFWVPGTWVEPPAAGDLWTPGYWGWADGVYAWNDGYWGSEVGFYGGVNYGFGYGGAGYQGGYWRGGQFNYNTYVTNVGASGNFHNTYNKTVVVNTRNYVSYNGGTGGITTRPTAAQETAAHAPHSAPTAAQSSQQRAAGQNHELLASVNHGRPAVAATSKPGEFSGGGVVAARGGAENKPVARNPVENSAAADKPKVPAATDNPASGNRTAGAATTENKPAEFKPTPERPATPERATPERAAPERATPERATPAPQPARDSARPAQPAARSDAPRSDVQPTHADSARPAHQAPAGRAESAPRPPAPQQHQAAAKPAAAPRAQQAHPSESKPDKPESR